MSSGFLTTHVLDTARGTPAPGIEIALFRLSADPSGPEGAPLIKTTITNADGRTDSPILPAQEFAIGRYELVFYVGAYLRATGQAGTGQVGTGQTETGPLFLDEIPIRFGINDPEAHYHVPLLLSPYGYSTYRGS